MKTDKEKSNNENEAIELKRQVDKYYSLPITQSARGQVVLVFAGLYALSIILSFFSLIELSDVLWSLIIYIPILIFVYKGHRWSMITLMILWTIEKMYTAYLTIENQGGSVMGSIIWLIIGLSVIYRALKIENERRKQVPVLEGVSVETEGNYCSQCGTKSGMNAKFCASCGSAQ